MTIPGFVTLKVAGPYSGPYSLPGAQFSCELFVTQGISSAVAGAEGIDSIEKE